MRKMKKNRIIQILVAGFIVFSPILFADTCFDAKTGQYCDKGKDGFLIESGPAPSSVEFIPAGYHEKGSIYVSAVKEAGELPWEKVPEGLFLGQVSDLKLREGWAQINETKTILLKSGTLKIVIANVEDPRGLRYNNPEIKLKNNDLNILIPFSSSTNMQTADYQAELSVESVILENLKQGEYNIFLGKKFAGKIKIS